MNRKKANQKPDLFVVKPCPFIGETDLSWNPELGMCEYCGARGKGPIHPNRGLCYLGLDGFYYSYFEVEREILRPYR